MSIQQFCLRWNNHQPNFISVFTTLLNTESLVDVTLAAEGKHLQAHKVVLSACSVYFQTLFTANPSRHPIVILKDVKYADLRIMVDFMYYGEVNVSQEQLPQILETAKMLKIKGLTEMPESASLTKSHSNSSGDILTPGESSWESQRHSISPCNLSPSVKRKRFRKTSTGSGSTQAGLEQRLAEDKGYEASSTSLDLVKSDTITLSSLPNQRRKDPYPEFGKDSDENGAIDATLQHSADDTNSLAVDPLTMESNPPGLTQGGGHWTMMEHTYPRYTNACLGGALQPDAAMAFNMNSMMHSVNMAVELGEYGGGAGPVGGGAGGGGALAGPSPGPSCAAEAQLAPDPPPPTAPAKRRRTSNPQSEENFQRALEAVRFGGIGFCKAARMFGVNNRTLWLEYKKKGYPNNRPSIKSRIKREHTSPPPEQKEEPVQPEQQMALLCPQHPVPVVGFIDSRPVDFPPAVHGVAHTSSLNLHGINFNTMQ